LDRYNSSVDFKFEDGFQDDLDFRFVNGVFDFLHNGIIGEYEIGDIEIDYRWDFAVDPIITPTIVHEWDYLDRLISKRVTNNAESVLSIGGGGTSRTHVYLTKKTKMLVVHNPGNWDLLNYPTNFGHIVVFKVRGIGEVLPYLDKTFEAVEIPSTLDHVVDPVRVIEEGFRVLKPAGRIGITLGNHMSWYRRVVRLLRLNVIDHHGHAHNFHFSSNEIEELLKLAGFIDVVTNGSSFLKLPKSLERKFTKKWALSLHRFISNQVLSKVFPANAGGMFLVTGSKP
jgi:SAM-dependent methyltransferase